MTGLKPVFAYYGGKTRLAPWIVSLLPPHRTYVEPFAGSAAALLAKPPSPTEIINDLDHGVIAFYRVLRERPEDLIRACELTPYARAEYDACYDLDVGDEVERARRWWVRTDMSIGKHPGSRRGSGWSAAPNSNGADHPKKLVTHVGRMRAVAERLRTVTIECRPATEVIHKYARARDDVAVYCDPPYLGTTRTVGRRGPRDYAVDMPTEDAHRELAGLLRGVPAAVLLSGYHSDLYDELYGDWHRLEVTVDRPSANGHGQAIQRATEVVWSNRPLNVQLGLLEGA